jgi:hypothetical protein
MRAMKNTDTAILDGQRIYYNHIRPHQGLNGKTPAQAAGLELEFGGNKWLRLYKTSSQRKDGSSNSNAGLDECSQFGVVHAGIEDLLVIEHDSTRCL